MSKAGKGREREGVGERKGNRETGKDERGVEGV